jgi:hypothetical protein
MHAVLIIALIAFVHGFLWSRHTRKVAAREAAEQTARQVYPLLYDMGTLRSKRKS